MEVRPRVGVSSCLLGEEVRFNGGHKRYRFLTDELGPYVDWVPYCPEISIGLGTPREPIRLTADGRLVNRSGTADHTAAMAALPLPAAGLDGYVFKAKSPSCGIRAIPRYGADDVAVGHDGRGLYADRVLTAFPLLAVEDEGRLNDAGLREAFCERIFASGAAAVAVLRAVVGGGPGGLPRPAQAAAAGARPGALPVGGPDRGPRRRGPVRGGIPGPVPGRDGQPGHPGPHRQRAAARVQPDRAAAWIGRGGWTWWPGSRPSGAARNRSACRSRCSRTTRAAGSSAGWRSKPSSGPFPRSCGCGIPFRRPLRRQRDETAGPGDVVGVLRAGGGHPPVGHPGAGTAGQDEAHQQRAGQGREFAPGAGADGEQSPPHAEVAEVVRVGSRVASVCSRAGFWV